jgi:hypothetical protein
MPPTDRAWKPSPFPRTTTEPIAEPEDPEPRRPRIRPALAARLRSRPGGVPRALVASAAAWGVAAFLTVWAGFDALGSDPDQRYAQDIRDQVGDSTVTTATQVHPQDVLALVVGACLFAALVFALLRRRWARPALSVLAVAAVVVLALGGHWEAAIVFFAFAVGAVTLLAESVQRYLT